MNFKINNSVKSLTVQDFLVLTPTYQAVQGNLFCLSENPYCCGDDCNNRPKPSRCGSTVSINNCNYCCP